MASEEAAKRRRSSARRRSLADRVRATEKKLSEQTVQERGLLNRWTPAWLRDTHAALKGVFQQTLGTGSVTDKPGLLFECETAQQWLIKVDDLLIKLQQVEWMVITLQPAYSNPDFIQQLGFLRSRVLTFRKDLQYTAETSASKGIKSCLNYGDLRALQVIERTINVIWESVYKQIRDTMRDRTSQFLEELKHVALSSAQLQAPVNIQQSVPSETVSVIPSSTGLVKPASYGPAVMLGNTQRYVEDRPSILNLSNSFITDTNTSVTSPQYSFSLGPA